MRIVSPKSRRCGISTVVESLLYHDTTTSPLTWSLIIGNQRGPSQNVLNMCDRFHRSTPETLAGLPFRPRLPDSYKANKPSDKMEFPDLDSRILIGSALSIDQYLSFGFQNIHATEVAYYPNGHQTFRALMPTLVKSPKSMLVLESSANGKSGPGRFFFEQVKLAEENEEADNWEYGAMRLVFIAWHEMVQSFTLAFADHDKRRSFQRDLRAEELDLIKRFNYISLEQLLWRRATIRGAPFNGDDELFDQEYPTDIATAFLATGISVYGRKHIKRLMNGVREPIWRGDIYWGDSDKKNDRSHPRDVVCHPVFLTEGEAESEGRKSHVNEGGRRNLKVWRWPEKGERIFVCGDVAGGDPDSKDGDFSTLFVGVVGDGYDRDEMIMSWRGHLNELHFAELSSALSWALYKRVGDEVPAPELAIEWNGCGKATNVYIDSKGLYPHTFRYFQPAVHGQPKTRHIGWESNENTKPLMIAFSRRMVEKDLVDVPDEGLVEEMSSYVQTGRFGGSEDYGGDAGTHDDRVTPFQIFCVRARTVKGAMEQSPVDELEEPYGTEDGDEPWDPFGDDRPRGRDDEEPDEETLFYTGLRA